MSRFGDYDGDGDDSANGGDLWTARARMALEGKRGRKALTDLREALLALPEKRLIEGALCTVGIDDRLASMPERTERVNDWTGEAYSYRNFARDPLEEYVEEHQGQPEGVCAIGAYIWHQKVKAGMDPSEAFASMPVGAEGEYETTEAGVAAGLTFTLAWTIANNNDERWGSLTPEQRHASFLAWIDGVLAKPPLTRPSRKRERALRRAAKAAAGRPTHDAPSLELGL